MPVGMRVNWDLAVPIYLLRRKNAYFKPFEVNLQRALGIRLAGSKQRTG